MLVYQRVSAHVHGLLPKNFLQPVIWNRSTGRIRQLRRVWLANKSWSQWLAAIIIEPRAISELAKALEKWENGPAYKHGRHATLWQNVSLLQGFGYLGLDSQCTSLSVLMSWDIKDWSVNCLPIDGRKEDCGIWYITVAVLLFVGKSPLYGDCMASIW